MGEQNISSLPDWAKEEIFSRQRKIDELERKLKLTSGVILSRFPKNTVSLYVNVNPHPTKLKTGDLFEIYIKKSMCILQIEGEDEVKKVQQLIFEGKIIQTPTATHDLENGGA